MTKRETAFRNWENNRENENITYEAWLAHDKENKKLWQKYMDRGNESRRLYAIYLKEVAKEENK
jgi:hypothetical protein